MSVVYAVAIAQWLKVGLVRSSILKFVLMSLKRHFDLTYIFHCWPSSLPVVVARTNERLATITQKSGAMLSITYRHSINILSVSRYRLGCIYSHTQFARKGSNFRHFLSFVIFYSNELSFIQTLHQLLVEIILLLESKVETSRHHSTLWSIIKRVYLANGLYNHLRHRIKAFYFLYREELNMD